FRDGTNLCSSARRPGGAIADCRQVHCAAQSTREAIETRLRLHASRGPQDTIAGQAPVPGGGVARRPPGHLTPSYLFVIIGHLSSITAERANLTLLSPAPKPATERRRRLPVRQSVSENRLPLSVVPRPMAEHLEGGWGPCHAKRPVIPPGVPPRRVQDVLPSTMFRRATTLPRLSGRSPANSGHSVSSSRCGVTAWPARMQQRSDRCLHPRALARRPGASPDLRRCRLSAAVAALTGGSCQACPVTLTGAARSPAALPGAARIARSRMYPGRGRAGPGRRARLRWF